MIIMFPYFLYKDADFFVKAGPLSATKMFLGFYLNQVGLVTINGDF